MTQYLLGRTRGLEPNGRGGLMGFGDAYPLKPGSKGPEVSDWQRVLASIGFSVTINGTFDAATVVATREFKGAVGLSDDSIVDDATLEAGASAVDAKGSSLTVPLEPGQGTPALNIIGKVKAIVPIKWWPWAIAGGAVVLVGLAAYGVSKASGHSPRRAHA